MLAWIGHSARLARVALTLARYDVLLPHAYRTRLPPVARAAGALLRLGARRPPGDAGERLAAALERLGPAWIKFGQFLATRPDIVGPEAAAALSRLKDRLPPFAPAAAEAALRAEFGDDRGLCPLGPAIAAASVAQVHKVRAPDGRDWAVKILRPDVERDIAREGAALAFGARVLEALAPPARRLRPAAFVATIREALSRELDLRLEAAAADAFAEIAARDGHVAAPGVDWERSGRRVVTTRWIEGAPLTAPHALDGADRPALAHKVTRGFLAAALDHGFFHADLHEGNLIATPGGGLALVDFGIMGRLTPDERRYLAEILWGFLRRDYRRCAQVHFEAGYVPADRSVDDFALALRGVGEPIWGKAARDVSMGRVLLHLFDVTERFGMALRPELVLLQKTMVQVEGVARAIDPDHDIWESARPVVARWIERELGPQAAARRAVAHAGRLALALARLPDLIEQAAAVAQRQADGPPRPAAALWLAVALSAACGGVLALLIAAGVR